MEKGFVKIFSPENSGKRLKIPTSFTYYKNRKLPMKINLRDRFGNMWPVGVNKIGGNLYFQYGWEKFIEDNSVEVGDFLVFDYDGNKMFDFKLLGRTKCEKNGVGGLKAEEMIVEHQKSRESKEKNWASDSYIFKSGRATQPKNPYFVAKIRSKRRDQLYVPVDVVKDYKLELPSSMTIRDSIGREFVTKLNKWKDGRIWLVGGWRSLCRWNLVEKNDHCICEFVRGKRNKDLHLRVQVLREGESSVTL
uniref:TF-B3 domain-containing protein n=1 Tax=Solanum lycopersicum TaxID=4081 RepID=A0A3Q7ERM3_SOLLC